MKVYNKLENFDLKSTVVTVGTFDGVHLGHKQIINTLIVKAKKMNATPVIFTFSPHPKVFFQKTNQKNQLLNTLSEKIELLEVAGIKSVVVYPFNKEFAQIDYLEFVHKFLVDKMNMKAMIIGYDNRFGNSRGGGKDSILELSKKLNFEIEFVEELKQLEQEINSTTIKKLLFENKINLANKLLGYNYKIEGKVVRGLQIGSEIGFPTANIEVEDENKLIPANGVYASFIYIDGNKYYSVLNIGNNPTIVEKQNQKTIEVHILNFSENIYGLGVEIELIKYLRSEIKFSSKEELINQIEKDVVESKSIFKLL